MSDLARNDVRVSLVRPASDPLGDKFLLRYADSHRSFFVQVDPRHGVQHVGHCFKRFGEAILGERDVESWDVAPPQQGDSHE